MIDKIKPYFDDIKHIKAEIIHDWVNYNVPVLAISSLVDEFDLKIIPPIMLQSPPRVFMQYSSELRHLVINPISLTMPEMKVAAEKLSNILRE